ncbi:P-loop containing nucleoside triphosphate hydrolase protein [Calocera viscosa TUFC12733]|uniref:p-loop containing nucleoside triphosphate hydrolase protein n=1 Tax=Calocera viscosa (strain TUFC12733) TaxID=1330018 RepID=A0A167MC87_CALVF|nr:P-loop containing nucleoside triphosphate hydrolase protein [Calocera viscosa TUFC12733]
MDDFEPRVVVLGAGGVGKSCLSIRYIKGTYEENYDPTIEEAYDKTIVVNGQPTRMQVVDTAGTEQFHAVISDMYLKPNSGYLLAFALDDYETLKALEPLYKQLRNWESAERQRTGRRFKSPVCLVGTKCDLEERTLARDKLEKQAVTWKLSYFETSAKYSVGVDAPFQHLTEQLVELAAEQQAENPTKAWKGGRGKKDNKKKDKKRICVIM